MADSGATRQRRYEAHKRGDHRYCRNCRELQLQRAERVESSVRPVESSGAIRPTVTQIGDTLSELRRMAPVFSECENGCRVLFAAVVSMAEADPPYPPMLVGQLARVMELIAACEHVADGPLGMLKARRESDRMAVLLDRLRGGGG